jgi:hypothetical protein
MRPTTTYPSTLDLLPKPAENATGHRTALLSVARTLLRAMRDGLTASCHQKLVGRGLTSDAAARRVFAARFKARRADSR